MKTEKILCRMCLIALLFSYDLTVASELDPSVPGQAIFQEIDKKVSNLNKEQLIDPINSFQLKKEDCIAEYLLALSSRISELRGKHGPAFKYRERSELRKKIEEQEIKCKKGSLHSFILPPHSFSGFH